MSHITYLIIFLKWIHFLRNPSSICISYYEKVGMVEQLDIKCF